MGNKLKAAMIFGNHMVLQRGKPIHVWGTCDGEKQVTIRLQGTEMTVKSIQGKWRVSLPPMEACESTEMEISTDEEHIMFSDVAVGEVWIAGGQSNMEFQLRYDAQRKTAQENPHIRMFDYPEVSYEEQIFEHDYSDFGFWRECTEENLDYFSAVGYYFAMQLEEKYHVPIGIVGCNWGGTPACAWMEPEYLKGSAGEVWIQEYEEQNRGLNVEQYEKEFAENPQNYRGKPFSDPFQEKMMYGMSEEEFTAMIQNFYTEGVEVKPPVIGPRSEKRPGGLYETMLKKIAPYAVKGVLWYQGENDEAHADVYDVVLERLIACWRKLWEETLPFLIVQLAPFEYWSEEGRMIFPMIREKQEWISRNVPDVWMASIMDVGMKKDIHPKQKKPVGRRLALLAQGHVYGEDILCDAPECIGLTVKDGKAVLAFANTGDGLKISGTMLQALELFVDGQIVEDFSFCIRQNLLKIQTEEIREDRKVEIRFAQKDYCEVNLFSSIGLPARPFTKSL